MKIVVAGGSGLIGRALCAELLRHGHEPLVLTRRTDLSLSDGVRSVTWAPPALGAWTSELVGAEAVINLAGESVGRWPWTPGRKRALRESRVLPTRALVTAMAAIPTEQRPSVLINASGTDLYEGRDAQPADEHTPPADTFLSRLCLDWEAEAEQAKAIGLRVVIARISLVIAPGAPSVQQLALPFRLLAGGPIGSGRQWMSWIDIADAVGLLHVALTHDDIRGPLNLSAPDPRLQADFARALAYALHRPSWFRTPAWAIRLVMGEQATLALGSRRVWPGKAISAGYEFVCPRLEDSLAREIQR